MPIADWYFDFVSPFAYLQCEQLAVARAAGRRSAIGRCCSPDCSSATARRARRRLRRSARSLTASSCGRRRGSACRSSFRPSIRSTRCRCCGSRWPATARRDAVQRIFRFVWRDGRLPDLPIEWAELTARARHPRRRDAHRARRRSRTRCGATPTKRSRAACSACRRSRSATSCSGAPMRPRWRADYVAAGCRFDDPEYARVAQLPVGATRARRRSPGNRADRKPAHRRRAAYSSPPPGMPRSRLIARAQCERLVQRRREAGHVAHLAAAARLGLAVEMQLRAAGAAARASNRARAGRRPRRRRTRCRPAD